MSDSFHPPGLLCPWDFLGKNTGVGCHFLLQGIFPTQGLNLSLLHWQMDSLLSKPPEKSLKKTTTTVYIPYLKDYFIAKKCHHVTMQSCHKPSICFFFFLMESVKHSKARYTCNYLFKVIQLVSGSPRTPQYIFSLSVLSDCLLSQITRPQQ